MAPFPFQIRQFPSALQDFASEMENIVENVLNQNGCKNTASDRPSESTYAPPLDIVEDETGFSLLLDLPGVASDSLAVELLDDRLHVSGSRTAFPLQDGAVVHRGERIAGKWARSIRLPKQIDTDRISADLQNGVLHLRLPKVPKATSRQIEIKTGA
jgi:HSP20 family molecular chaperone IbpA